MKVIKIDCCGNCVYLRGSDDKSEEGYYCGDGPWRKVIDDVSSILPTCKLDDFNENLYSVDEAEVTIP